MKKMKIYRCTEDEKPIGYRNWARTRFNRLNYGESKMKKIDRQIFMAVAIAGLGATQSIAAVLVDYNPDQIGSVSAPIVGLGATSNDYLLTASGATGTLDKNFNGNNQEQFAFGNPDTAQDAA